MIRPDPNDPIKIRRLLALWICVYAFLVLPAMLIIAQAWLSVDADLLRGILTYTGILAAGPVGAYLYAAQKNGNREQ